MLRRIPPLLLLLSLAVRSSPQEPSIIDDTSAIELEIPGDSATDSLPPIDVMPQLTVFVKADFPDSLVQKGIEGLVVMDLVVTDSGRVDSVKVVQGLHPVLDSAAVHAARKFTYTPAKSGGQPIPVLVQFPYRFSVDEVVKKIKEYVNFSGTVIEMGTRAPVADANVVVTPVVAEAGVNDSASNVAASREFERIGSLAGQSYEEGSLIALTDSLGRFAFTSLPAGPVTVRVIAAGCKDFTEDEEILRDKVTEVKYRIERASYSEYEIVAYGRLEKKEVAHRELSSQSVRRIPGLSGDPVLAVQALPGVARPSFGGGEIIVRGAGVNDNRYFLDGVEIPTVYHMNLGLLKSVYNSYALRSLNFYPGGFGVRYGDVVGSVIELNGRPSKKDRWHGYADLSFSDFSVALEVPVNKYVSVLGAARRSHIGDLLKWLAEDVVQMNLGIAAAPFYEDFLLRVDVNPVKGHDFFASALAVKESLCVIFEDIRGGSSDVDENTDEMSLGKRFSLAMAGYDAEFTDRLSNTFRYGLMHGSAKMSVFGFYKLEIEGFFHTIRDQIDYVVRDGLTLSAGIDLSIKPSNGTVALALDSIVKHKVENLYGPLGAYLTGEWKPVEGLTITPGLRYDYYPDLDAYHGTWLPEFWDYDINNSTRFSGDPSLRINGKYRINDRHAVKGAIGSYNSAPRTSYDMGFGRDLAHSEAVDSVMGNPDLATTKASHYVLGYEWRIADLVSLDAQGYYNQQWDVTRMPDNSDAVADFDVKRFVDNGKARMFGLELLLTLDQGGRFYGWLAYTLARAERYDNAREKYTLYDRDILNNAQLILGMKLRGNMELGLRLRYTDGYPTYPLEEVEYYDATYLYYKARFGTELTDRFPPFVGVDLRFEKRFVFKRWMLTMYLEGLKLAHILQFVDGKDGEPLYKPTEMDLWYYDYSGKEGMPDIPLAQVGLQCDF